MARQRQKTITSVRQRGVQATSISVLENNGHFHPKESNCSRLPAFSPSLSAQILQFRCIEICPITHPSVSLCVRWRKRVIYHTSESVWTCTRRCTVTFRSQATWSSHLSHKHCFHRYVRTHIIPLRAAFQLDYCFPAVLLTQAIIG